MQAPTALRVVVMATCLVATCCCGAADAAQRRSAAARKKKLEDRAFLQLEMMRYQTETAAAQQELFQSFDKDGDGKLSPPEKAAYEKHLKDIEKGAAQNPFQFIAPVGQGPRPKKPLDELQTQSIRREAGITAKQQELVQRFDEDGDGQLKGPEQSRFQKYMHEVQTGKVPDPFATIGTPASTGK